MPEEPTRLPFEIDETIDPSLVTAKAGVPLVIEQFRRLGVAQAIDDHVHIKQRRRSLRPAQLVETLIALWNSGGDRSFWELLVHRSTLAVCWPTSVLTDSRLLVVFRLPLEAPKTPSRWRVGVSSKPSSQLVTVDSFRSRSSWRHRSRIAFTSAQGGTLVGLRELPEPGGSALGPGGHHVLPFVPLTALGHRLGSEDCLERGPEALGPVDDTEEALIGAQAPLDYIPGEDGGGAL